jgi:peroxiredoxin
MTASIADQASELKQGFARQAPASVVAAFAADQARLDADGIPADVAVAGTAMPDGALLDARGAATTLTGARDGQRAVVVFYRGEWCPYCNIALRTYQAALAPELAARGARLIAVSPQKPDGSLSMQEKNDLTFTVLSDPGNQLAGKLGILTAPSADSLAAQAALGLDLTAANADGTVNLPMPTVVIVDAGGVIRWIDVHPDYTERSEPAAILAALDRAASH